MRAWRAPRRGPIAEVLELADARRRLVEHAEYGQWELQRSVHHRDGARRYWMRRRVMRVASTLQTV